jgi:hypothetical protein
VAPAAERSHRIFGGDTGASSCWLDCRSSFCSRVFRGERSARGLATEALSGFSESVRLGDVARIKLNPGSCYAGAGSDCRRRRAFGSAVAWVTLDRYDGRSWTGSGAWRPATRRTEEGLFGRSPFSALSG